MALSGFCHDVGRAAGANLVGDAAKGIPRYLVTMTLAPLSDVVVPTTGPESTVTVGVTALVGAV